VPCGCHLVRITRQQSQGFGGNRNGDGAQGGRAAPSRHARPNPLRFRPRTCAPDQFPAVCSASALRWPQRRDPDDGRLVFAPHGAESRTMSEPSVRRAAPLAVAVTEDRLGGRMPLPPRDSGHTRGFVAFAEAGRAKIAVGRVRAIRAASSSGTTPTRRWSSRRPVREACSRPSRHDNRPVAIARRARRRQVSVLRHAGLTLQGGSGSRAAGSAGAPRNSSGMPPCSTP